MFGVTLSKTHNFRLYPELQKLLDNSHFKMAGVLKRAKYLMKKKNTETIES